MSDTPETDIECFIYEGDYVPASFARQLERERDEARKEVERLKAERDNWRVSSVCRELNAELERLKADKARLDWLIEHGANDFFEVLSEYPSQARNAIDAAMKGDAL